MWFFGKTYSLIFVMVWFRGTLPRLRVDQLMGLAWKFFLPLAIVNIIAAGIWALSPLVTGTLVSAALLLAVSWVLVQLNRPASLSSRTYILAD